MPDHAAMLKQRIDEAEHSSEVVAVLDRLAPLLAENPSSQELSYVLVDAFQALRTLTSEQRAEGEQEILAYLLDYLEKDSHGTAIQQSATSQLRECLETWITQYPEQESITLRAHILDDLLHRFQVRTSRALCWTFSHIGYREERLVSTLWDCALRDEDEVAETAIVTLTALGVPQTERSRLLEVVHRKLQRHVTQPLLIALHRLADPASFQVMCDLCFLPQHAVQTTTAAFPEGSFALSVLTAIADAHDDEEKLQDRVWLFIAEQYDRGQENMVHAVNLGGGIAPGCNSRHVVPTLLSWLGQASDEEKQQQRIPVLSYRLEECVRPPTICAMR
jgi:hypothetical protein